MSISSALQGLLRAALIFLAALGATGCATRMTSAEKMTWSTYALATPKGMGTCVVINRRDPQAPNGIAPIILSSSHLLSETPRGPFYLVFRQPVSGDNPSIGFLELRAPEPIDRPFVRHPFYDVAALRLEIPPEFADKISFPSYVAESSIGGPGTQEHVGDQVSILGYPHVFPGTEGGFPVLRGGRVASYSAVGYRHPDEFLVNTSVFAGDSGGPVFATNRSGKPALIGMIVERVGQERSGVPLAVAVNATAIRETLQMQAQREKDYQNGRTPNSLNIASTGIPRVKLVGPPKTLKEMFRLWKRHR